MSASGSGRPSLPLPSSPATEQSAQRMEENLEHKINVVIGLFVLSCLACTIFYGPYMLIVCVLGLFIIAAILNRLAK